MDWILFLHIFTIVNKILLFPLFFFRKNNALANRMLALLILLPAFPIISNYIFYTRPIEDFPNSLFISQIVFSMFGPIYFFYSMEMIGRPFKFTAAKLLHLFPSVMIFILWMVYFFSGNESRQLFMQSFNRMGAVTMPMFLACWFPILLVTVYVFYSAWKVYRYISRFKDVFTNLENFKVSYIREFTTTIILQIVILATVSFFTSIWYLEMVWVPIFGNLLYFYIVYKCYSDGVIFSEADYEAFSQRYIPLRTYIQEDKRQPYAKSSLSDGKIEEYADVLIQGFENEKWYLDPELNLSIIAEKTNIPGYAISRVINQKFERNFFDLVNYYRVEEFKKRLLDKKYAMLKLEALAYMCGFNSKAAFQRAFKKHTGLTPTAFKKNSEHQMAGI